MLLPAATVTVAGTVKLIALELSETVDPPDGAAPLRVTVQVDEPEGPTDKGLQDRVLTTGADTEIEIVPPVPVMGSESPPAVAARTLLMLTAEALAPLFNVRVATPTTPLEIMLASLPDATHV